MSPDDLRDVLVAHDLWLRNEPRGRRANLEGADLAHAGLGGANLVRATLAHADLRGAYLEGATLVHANLEGAYLVDADIRGAILAHANLVRANLEGATLAHADLRGANLAFANIVHANLEGAYLVDADIRGASIDPPPTPTGRVIGLKALRDQYIARLEIAADVIARLEIAADVPRTASYVGRKCRSAAALVTAIYPAGSSRPYPARTAPALEGVPNGGVVYRLGEIAEPNSYDEDPRVECTYGIHWFTTREEAEEWLQA